MTGSPNNYEGDYFTANQNGIIQFHHTNEIYFGTWISFFIGDELHLNMSMVATVDIADQFNYDWKVVFLSEGRMELLAGEKELLLEKNCAFDCTIGVYQACELEGSPGQAIFELQEYSLCMSYIPNHDLATAVLLTYFETELDAQNNINQVSPIAYTNISSPQTIYVRIEEIISGDFLGISNFLIEAIACP